MSYHDFFREMDRINRKGTTTTVDSLNDLRMEIMYLKESVTKILANNCDRVDALYDKVYKILPELEIIETMADNPEEEAELVSKYLNLNEDYLD